MRFRTLKLYKNSSEIAKSISDRSCLIRGTYQDSRSNELHSLLNISEIFTFYFDSHSLEVNISGKRVSLRGLFQDIDLFPLSKADLINSVIDITTLNVSEILLLVKIAQSMGIEDLCFSYGEAGGYRKVPEDTESLASLDGRNFSLSDELPEFKPVPFATISPNRESDSRGVIVFGFERDRVAKLFYDHEGIAEFRFYGMFQVPPSKPGWENDSTAQHFDIIDEQRQSFDDFFFSSATDPNSTYFKIKRISKSFNSSECPLFVVPVGPKPTTLAVVASWLDNLCQGIYFDYPKLSPNRSLSLRGVHIYRLAMNKDSFKLEK